jgi:hypothetical protein
MRLGVIGAAITLAVGFVLAESGLASRWGFVLALPLTLSTYWLLSGVSGTCFMAGMRGQRRADYGAEPVVDSGQARRFRRRALVLLTASFVVGLVSAGAFSLSV